MAPFNPPIQPTNDPNYGANSRSVDTAAGIRPQGVQQNQITPEGQKIGDRSAEYLGQADAYASQGKAIETKGLGDLFAGIASSGDFLAKAGVNMVNKDIENKVYDIANRERQAYTQRLEDIKRGTGVKDLLNANASMDAPEQEVPTEVAELGDNLSSIQGAKDSGKISNTYYRGRLLAEAKDLRAKYPGFREEIDAQFAKVTGVNPANAYINSLVSDINKSVNGAGSEQNKLLTYVRNNNGYPGSVEAYQKVQSGEWKGLDVQRWAAPYEQQKLNLQMKSLQFQDVKSTREEKKAQAGELFDTASGTVVNQSIDKLLIGLKLRSESDASNLDSQYRAGAMPAGDFAAIGQQVNNHRLDLQLAMKADADKSGLTKILGVEEVNKRIEASLKPFDQLNDRIYNKDFGGIYYTAQSIKAQTDDNQKRMLANPKIGPYFQTIQALKQIGGEQNLQSFFLDNIRSDIPDKFKQYHNNFAANFATQNNMKTSGVPITLNDMFDDMRDKKISDDPVATSKMTNKVINQITSITSKDTPDAVKMNYALTAFSPENRGFIGRLNIDGVDEKGRQIQGQNAVYQKLTSPEMTKEMARLGKSNRAIFDNYVNWAQETFGNELMNREVNDLSKLSSDGSIKVYWDSDNKRFGIKESSGATQQERLDNRFPLGGAMAQSTSLSIANRSINRINSNLNNLKNVAEASGGDVDAFLLKTIASVGGPEALKNVGGIPAQMLKTITDSRNFNSRFKGRGE